MNFVKTMRKPAARPLAWIGLATILVSSASGAGLCLTTGSSLYGGGILGTAPSPFEAGCTYGLSTNVGSNGGVVTTTPGTLPSPVSSLTAATMNFTDPTGTSNLAAANLANGTLGAYDAGSATGGSNGPGAALNDTVHFSVSGGPTLVPFSVHVSGTESGTGLFNNNFQLNFVGVLQFEMDNLGGHPGDFNVGSDPGWGTFSGESQDGFTYSGMLMVTNGEAIPITMALSLACVSGETCDFSHTASVAFALPSNVTFTSDSGVFLTQADSTAPEPASVAMIGAGLAALIAFRKKLVRG